MILHSGFALKAQQQLYFSPNAGQWDEPIVAKSIFKGGAIFIRKNGFRIKMLESADLPNIHKAFHYRGIDTAFVIHGHTIDVAFQNSDADNQISVAFEEEAQWYENYFLGDDPKRWKSEIYPVKKIRLRNIYPHIDFIIYTKGEEVEFDWVVQPGGNPEDIRMQFTGQDSLVQNQGNIQAISSVGIFTIKKPIAKQFSEEFPCEFLKVGNQIGFHFTNTEKVWDKSIPLTIDPVLVFSTYSGSRGDNFGFTATYDTAGCLYAGGIVDIAQGTYPVTPGAFQTIYGGRGPAAAPVFLPCDVSISKYKPDGSALIYATYLGGKSNEYPHSLGLDEKNNLLVFGTTLSNNFPIPKNTAVDSGWNGGHDIYVVKLSANGTSMLAGTYLGGTQNDGINNGTLHFNYADDFRGDIISDGNGNIYVATCTRSPAFPSVNGMQPVFAGGLDGVAICLNKDLSQIIWSTFLGGSNDDAAYSLKLDDSLNLFVGGGTSSSNFPMAGNGLNNTYLGGNSDGWVTKLSNDSGKLKSSTFYGTNAYDQIYFVDYDIKNQIYVTGQTEGQVNRTAGTYGKNNTTQFIGRLNNALDSEEFVTTFGYRSGAPELSPCAFLVDKCYNIYFSGWGSSVGVGNAGTSANLEVSSNAFQKTTDDNDFYLLVLGKDAKSLIYATYFGGDSSEDHVDGGTSRFDKRGVIYQSVCSSCPPAPPGLNDFPTTPGAAFPVNVSYRCSNASFKFDFNITYAVEAKFIAEPQKVCYPDTIFFYQSNTFGKTFKWTFGDGDSSNQVNPYHIYAEDGKYTVRLVVTDSGSCNVTDTFDLEVEVLTSPQIELQMKLDHCSSYVDFEVTGENMGNPEWDLGDGTKTSGTKVRHSYFPGNYSVKVIATHPVSGCKDSIEKPFLINKDSSNEIYLANVFTPDGDTKNDCYRVYGLSKECDESTLKIFNRWGERIYYSDDLTQCWNGKVENIGVDLPEGVYFYQIHIKSKDGEKKDKYISGSVTLIR